MIIASQATGEQAHVDLFVLSEAPGSTPGYRFYSHRAPMSLCYYKLASTAIVGVVPNLYAGLIAVPATT